MWNGLFMFVLDFNVLYVETLCLLSSFFTSKIVLESKNIYWHYSILLIFDENIIGYSFFSKKYYVGFYKKNFPCKYVDSSLARRTVKYIPLKFEIFEKNPYCIGHVHTI